MNELEPSVAACIARIREILADARHKAWQSVNAVMVSAYWEIGREIVVEEQSGRTRAEYGARMLHHLAEQLTSEFGKGFGERTLRSIRQFYLAYARRVPPIRNTPSSELPLRKEIRNTVCSESGELPRPLAADLSWSHYRVLMRVTHLEARDFYEAECAKASWSVRELQRQIASFLFERLARSRDREGVLGLAREGHEVSQAADLIKDPYILEFVGLPEATRWLESDLEQALIDRLQHFLLELGRDLFFVARQKRITVGEDHFYVDLVFYHRELRCFLLVDLKMGRLSQQDIGQMLLYTGFFEAEEVRQGENPPIGLILCTDKNEAIVRYTLSGSAQQVFASRYRLHLPTEAELAEEIRRERQELEMQRLLEQRSELDGGEQ